MDMLKLWEARGTAEDTLQGTLTIILFSVSMGQDNSLDSPYSLLSCSFLLVRGVRRGDPKTKSLQVWEYQSILLNMKQGYSANLL